MTATTTAQTVTLTVAQYETALQLAAHAADVKAKAEVLQSDLTELLAALADGALLQLAPANLAKQMEEANDELREVRSEARAAGLHPAMVEQAIKGGTLWLVLNSQHAEDGLSVTFTLPA
jgi:hypothetical protein